MDFNLQEEKFVTVFLEGLEEQGNQFIKAQLQKILSEGGPLLKSDLEVELPASHIIVASKTGGIVKLVKIKDKKGKIVKEFTEEELQKVDLNNEKHFEKFMEILDKGSISVVLTAKGWQETFREILSGLKPEDEADND